MTWKELKDRISRMTEEEQQQNVAIWGEDFSLRNDCCLVKTSEDEYYNNKWMDCCIGVGELSEEDLKDPDTKLICKAGMYLIFG